MGETTLKDLVDQRKQNFLYLKKKVGEVAAKYKERVLDTPSNKISLAVTLTSLEPLLPDITFFGSYLFSRRISGVRVVGRSEAKQIGCVSFKNYGSHAEDYKYLPYFNCAASIG